MIKIYDNEKYQPIIRKVANQVLKYFNLSEKDMDIEINIIKSDEIKRLNNEFRHNDNVTDVLSFANINKKPPYDKDEFSQFINPEDKSLMLGEIFICDERAKEQAKEYGHSIEREMSFLTCHGMLHLLGYNHYKEEEEEEMKKLQKDILDTKLNIKREMNFKSGFVAVMGRPNAGKSTLINTLVGEKVSIVSWKPQTTRDKILGIYNDKETQIVFIDTPGLHAPKNNLGKYMMKSARAAVEGVDAVVYIIDGEKGFLDKDKENLKGYLKKGLNTIAVVNKVDHVTKEKVFEILGELNDYKELKAVVPLSALKEKNTDILLDEIKKLLTDTIKYYPEDMFTDKNMRFMVAETIREKTLRLLDKEVPYGIGVEVSAYERRENKDILEIEADIVCEKPAHKPIILGKGGSMIKKIGTYARQDIEKMTGHKVFLKLFVKVKEDWRGNDYVLKELGYNPKN